MAIETIKELQDELAKRELSMNGHLTPEGFCVWLFAPLTPEIGVFLGSHDEDLATAIQEALDDYDEWESQQSEEGDEKEDETEVEDEEEGSEQPPN